MLMIIPSRSIKDGRLSRQSIKGALKLTRSGANCSGLGVGERVGRPKPRVDQDIESPEPRDRLGDQVSGRRGSGQVGCDREDFEIRSHDRSSPAN
jgi:hypothetical protein